MAVTESVRSRKSGFEYEALFPYYPTRFDVSYDEDLETIRRIVWSFKDGLNGSKVAEALSNGLKEDEDPMIKKYEDWHFCIIPASTEEKTQVRFQDFCSEVCRQVGLKNGYDLIQNSNDRIAIHLAEDRNNVNIIDHILINNVKSKKILLFDDVYTTGKSFSRLANKLCQLGASEVKGLFLAKTNWL